ncbi:MAG: CRISPR system precrRNA processing endoribonuclease RAMP protein Cas6 [Desulfuromonadaceae bacterium]|nr:CRISPR system precrRNA processing endoribonuclease RAMP protein Cas6 [Desulfuromonadaceae bacterium]
MDLDFVRIECEVTSDIAAQLTVLLYDGLRNFDVHFKTSSCLTLHEVCPSCREHDVCPYWMVFSQKLSSDPEIVRLHQKPPLPFALYINEKVSLLSTDTVTVGLVIIGTAVNHVEHFHTALLGMVERTVCSVNNPAPYALQSYSLDYQGVRHGLLPGTLLPDNVILFSGHHILHDSVHSDSIRISLKSPLRLLCHGATIHLFDFAPFFRSQMRRCSSFCAYYGSGKLDLDFGQLSARAQNVTVFDDQIRYSQPRWSKRQNKAGLIGSAECSGLVEPMSALLFLGSYFNAGKGATFGSGQYEIEVM